ncbi:hypothetical protein GCM10010462_17000 [Microbacterium dextranolyticum]|uniref:Uncharacterized protein n=1 Tax=Microbacterium dextranolyticum TaxID=36806 RepID=A0A9W6HLZ9_9MICO|nr:hypothetical protein GCM10017591_09160 [Microbacterium dextranolyticum]
MRTSSTSGTSSAGRLTTEADAESQQQQKRQTQREQRGGASVRDATPEEEEARGGEAARPSPCESVTRKPTRDGAVTLTRGAPNAEAFQLLQSGRSGKGCL